MRHYAIQKVVPHTQARRDTQIIFTQFQPYSACTDVKKKNWNNIFEKRASFSLCKWKRNEKKVMQEYC
jgi:hypothetical protein